jgi:hypothetical protein
MFRENCFIQQRKDIYSQIYKNYNFFVTERLKELPVDFLLNKISLRNLDNMWNNLIRKNNDQPLHTKDLETIFKDYYSSFRLKHNIDPILLVRLLSKNDGLLRNVSQTEKPILMQDFENIINHLIIITNEDLCGHSLFAGEIMSLLIWNIHMSQEQSFITFNDPEISIMYEILTEKIFSEKIKNQNIISLMSEEFSFYASKDEYSLFDPENNLFSFELFKELFLERNILENRQILNKN